LINYFFYSAIRGRRAPQNPWKSNTLEWTTPVEHLHGNWPGEIPSVYRWAYDYSKPGAEDDYIPQTVPDKDQNDPMEESTGLPEVGYLTVKAEEHAHHH